MQEIANQKFEKKVHAAINNLSKLKSLIVGCWDDSTATMSEE